MMIALSASLLAFSPGAPGALLSPALARSPPARMMPTWDESVRKLKKMMGQSTENENAVLIKEIFDSGPGGSSVMFGEAIVDWYNRHLSFDFEGCFEGGKV